MLAVPLHILYLKQESIKLALYNSSFYTVSQKRDPDIIDRNFGKCGEQRFINKSWYEKFN